MSAQEQPVRVEKPELAREANERIAEAADRHRFVARMPLFCECDDPDCREIVLLSRADFNAIRREPRLFVTAPGHQPHNATRAGAVANYWLIRHPPDEA